MISLGALERAMRILVVTVTALGLLYGLATPAAAQDSDATARSRPRVVIHPRRIEPGPNSVRQCRATLVQEYRVSGAVIVPRMRCWWK